MISNDVKRFLTLILLSSVFHERLALASPSILESRGVQTYANSVDSTDSKKIPQSTDILRESGVADDGLFYPSLATNPTIASEARLYLSMPFRYLLDEDGVNYPDAIGNITVGEVIISLEHDLIEEYRNQSMALQLNSEEPLSEQYPEALRRFNQAIGLITSEEMAVRDQIRRKRSIILGTALLTKSLYCNPLNCCVVKVGLKKFLFSWPCCLLKKLWCCACFWG